MMGYILDAGVILVIGVCLFLGYRRGFVRGLISLAGALAALMVAGWLCGPIAETTFDLFFAGKAQAAIQEQLPETVNRDEAVRMLDDYLAKLRPDGARELLNKGGCTDGRAIVDKLPDAAFNTQETLAKEITARVVRPVTVPVISAVSFLLLFLLLIIVVQIVARMVNKVFELPVLRTFNHVGGLAIGALHGIMWVLALVTLVQLYAMFYSGSLVSQKALHESVLMRWISEHNPVAGVIQGTAEKLVNR